MDLTIKTMHFNFKRESLVSPREWKKHENIKPFLRGTLKEIFKAKG